MTEGPTFGAIDGRVDREKFTAKRSSSNSWTANKKCKNIFFALNEDLVNLCSTKAFVGCESIQKFSHIEALKFGACEVFFN